MAQLGKAEIAARIGRYLARPDAELVRRMHPLGIFLQQVNEYREQTDPLTVGTPIDVAAAEPGFDVVILNRGGVADPTVIDAPGHVGFFDHRDGDQVVVLGGNQGDRVSVAPFRAADVLGVRRL